MAEGSGIVERVLRDDNDGSRHQRFILRIESGHTLLVSHNIDLASRLADPEAGDTGFVPWAVRVEHTGRYPPLDPPRPERAQAMGMAAAPGRNLSIASPGVGWLTAPEHE